MSHRTKRKIRQARKRATDLMEHDIAVLELLILKDVDPLDLKRDSTLEAKVATPNGKILWIPARYLRRRNVPSVEDECPNCEDGTMVFDHFYRFWQCKKCDWRMPE